MEGDDLKVLREALAHVHDEEFEQSWLRCALERIRSVFRGRGAQPVIKIQELPPKREDNKDQDAA